MFELAARGWLMAWWFVVPASAMVGVWLAALHGDRMLGERTPGSR